MKNNIILVEKKNGFLMHVKFVYIFFIENLVMCLRRTQYQGLGRVIAAINASLRILSRAMRVSLSSWVLAAMVKFSSYESLGGRNKKP